MQQAAWYRQRHTGLSCHRCIVCAAVIHSTLHIRQGRLQQKYAKLQSILPYASPPSTISRALSHVLQMRDTQAYTA
eukprot:6172703-Pleurochrysis_carterae.AAC.2